MGTQGTREKAELIGKIVLARFLKLSEERYRRFIGMAEESPLFKRLVHSPDNLFEEDNKIIGFRPFPKAAFINHKNVSSSETIASIIKNSDYLTIGFDSPALIREYVINRKKLRMLKKRGYFTESEKVPIDTLLKKLRLIDTRKKIVYQVLCGIIDIQSSYLKSGDFEDLTPLTQKELGRKIGVDNTWISRVIDGKFVITPLGKKALLNLFFPNKKKMNKYLIKNLFDKERRQLLTGELPRPRYDDELREMLKEKYKISVTRRCITAYRRGLGIASSRERLAKLKMGNMV